MKCKLSVCNNCCHHLNDLDFKYHPTIICIVDSDLNFCLGRFINFHKINKDRNCIYFKSYTELKTQKKRIKQIIKLRKRRLKCKNWII